MGIVFKEFEKQKVFQLANDKEGETDIEILNEKPLRICTIKVGSSSPIPRIWLIDVQKKKAQMIKPLNSDMAFEAIEVIDSNRIF